MKNTKNNVVKLLKELQKEALTMSNAYRILGIEAGYEHHKGKYLAYGTVIGLLADEDYFNYANGANKNKG